MVTPGGEISHVIRMITESIQLKERVIWYTSMLGKLSSVSMIVEKLIELGNHNYAVTEFVQGNKTKRWAIAWSWTDLRPTVVWIGLTPLSTKRALTSLQSVARGIPGFPKHLLPFPSEYTFELPDSSIDKVGRIADTELSSLHVHWVWRKNLAMGVGFAPENVWSRQYRRKMKISNSEEKPEVDEGKAALGFKIQLKMDPVEDKLVRVVVRWLKGTDSVLFESFCGMIKRKLEGR
jgi:23S rRNA (adenine1618-N6)-methyltransferase